VAIDLRARLKQDKPFYFIWATMPGAVLAGQLARLPYEAVCIDMQHGLSGFSDAVVMIPEIVAAGKPAMIRVLWNEPGLIGQALDVGASAIIVPMINSAKEAAALVKAAKYPPIGMRSWGGYAAVQAAGLAPSAYLSHANQGTLAFAMVETQEALDNVDAIAATPGLDGLFIGPNDLGISLGHGLNADLTIPKLDAAVRKIGAAAAKSGLIAGAFGGNPTNCRYFAERGFRFIVAVTEVGLLAAGAKTLQAASEHN
jgi:4-hydroxy-2-oxoheptanedioate aldolase